MSVAWIHGRTPTNCGAVNMTVVARTKAWIEEVLGVPAVLVIERSGERNRAAFRVALRDGFAEIEVKAVHPLLKMRRSKAWQLEQLMALIEVAA